MEPIFFSSEFPQNLNPLKVIDKKKNVQVVYSLVSLSRFILISTPILLIKLFKHWNKINIKNKELKRRNLENRMQLLRNQIHPHFLFNTLNNLYSLALEKSDKVPELIIKISDILRYMLKEHNKKIVTLKEELDIISTYINLEKLRYGKEFNIEINNEVKEIYHSIIKGPPLVLLTLVENAFKHGPGKSTHESWIKIDLKYKSGIFTFMVENSKEQDDNQNRKKNNGLGLKNLKATQELFFPNKHSLEIIDRNDTFKTILKINYSRDEYKMFNR
ncbi:MAG: sensor histidine kinase [Bacteroidales bacterium]|jgi:LytS/YehU family sensor histidine kinase|nr:sensor histidine kinase [Bacteroidales bacterium]